MFGAWRKRRRAVDKFLNTFGGGLEKQPLRGAKRPKLFIVCPNSPLQITFAQRGISLQRASERERERRRMISGIWNGQQKALGKDARRGQQCSRERASVPPASTCSESEKGGGKEGEERGERERHSRSSRDDDDDAFKGISPTPPALPIILCRLSGIRRQGCQTNF